MEDLLKHQPVPEIAAVSPGGWLGASAGSDHRAPSGAFEQHAGKDDTAEPNIFTDNNGSCGGDSTPEMTVKEEQDDTPKNTADKELVAEEDDTPKDATDEELVAEEEEDLDLAETRELSANGLSHDGENGAGPAVGEEDAEGTDESISATDGEGDE